MLFTIAPKVAGEVVVDAIDVIIRGAHVDDAVAMQWSPVVDGVSFTRNHKAFVNHQ